MPFVPAHMRALRSVHLDYYLTTMATDPLSALVTFDVTPRFEVFYALRALQQPSQVVAEWATKARTTLGAKFDATVRRVAPRPIMWPLLADTLRDAKADATFDEVIEAIDTLDNNDFQRAILGGVFRGSGVVEDILSGKLSLRDAVEAEGRNNNQLLSLLGLEPFERSKVVGRVFGRIISRPAEYRAELSRVLQLFWRSAFESTWQSVNPRMKRRAAAMRDMQATRSIASFAREERLPVVFDDEKKIVTSTRGATLYPYQKVRAIHVIPSAFNDARFWGAYGDASGLMVLYFPVFDPDLLQATLVAQTPGVVSSDHRIDPSMGFRALGDTTRYAMAGVLARSPQTSAELAREFNVSKATVSHHVQMLRHAGLLIEKATDRGVVLSLNRAAMESLSHAAVQEMFASRNPAPIKRSRHERDTRKKQGERGEKTRASTGQAE